MTKFGQTYKFALTDHLSEIKKYLGKYPDTVVVNNSPLPKEALDRYKKEKNDYPVKDNLRRTPYTVIRTDLLSREIVRKHTHDLLWRSLIRHDSNKVAKVLLSIFDTKNS
jgi:2-phospho-L-lactate transferase/gluconeogenesis factor (CofD/UPF0052 family)